MLCEKCGNEFEGTHCQICETKFDQKNTHEKHALTKYSGRAKTKSKKRRIIILSIVVLSVLSAFLLCLFKVINIPFLANLFSKTKNFDENNIGEVYFYQTDVENIVTSEDGFFYVNNEILLVASDASKYADIEKLAKENNAKVVGWIEQTGDYQLQINRNCTYDELVEITSSLKESKFVNDAYVNFAFEMSENKTEERNGFIYGNEWEKDLQNFNNCKGKSWGIEAVETLAAWDVLNAYKSSVIPVKVGLIDTGFDTNHEDLGFAETFYNEGIDIELHGTHVAGTIAAKSNNQEGICGVYPYGDGNLYGVSLKGINKRTENTITSMGLKIAYSELILRNVKVINTSWGFEYGDDPNLENTDKWKQHVGYTESNSYILADFLSRLLENGYDFVLVTSAGNDSNRANGIVYDSKYNFWTTVISEEDYPDVYNRIIVVGAVNLNFEICDFSNGGDRVDIYAPGDTIFSTTPNNGYQSSYREDGKTKLWSGTSMAAPHVSGVAAMVWSVNNNLTGAQVKEIICESHSFRCNSCDMIDAYIALQKATHLYSTENNSGSAAENGGVLAWVVSAENVNTRVQNAAVTLTNIQSGETVDTTTDVYGHFECFVPSGNYTLSVVAENYEDYSTPEGSYIAVRNNSVEYLDDWIKMEPQYSNEEIFGTYKGAYFVGQDEIGLTLIVYDEGARYKAIFEFYNLPGNNNTENGKFKMDVSYDTNTNEYFFEATEWVVQPSNYDTIDLCGTLSGNILKGDLPIRFLVEKNDDLSDELFYKYVEENLNISTSFPNDENEEGVFSVLVEDFDNDGKKEMITFSIVHNEVNQASVIVNLYVSQNGNIVLADTSEEIAASGIGNYSVTMCGLFENSTVKIQSDIWDYAGSLHGSRYLTYKVTNNKLVLCNDYFLREFFRYESYDYKESVSGKIFSSSDDFLSAVEKSGFDTLGHFHVGYSDSEFDMNTDDYTTAECFKGNHIFTLFEDNYIERDGFIHDNTNLNDNISANLETRNYVVDAFSETLSSRGFEVKYTIPKIVLNYDSVDDINEKIWNDKYSYIQSQIESYVETGFVTLIETSYEWAINGDVLSLWIKNQYGGETSPCERLEVYNLSISTGRQLANSDILAAVAFSEEDFVNAAKKSVFSGYLSYFNIVQGWTLDEGVANCQPFISWTISEEHIKETCVPFINQNGELCVAAYLYPPGGPDCMIVCNLENFEFDPSYEKYLY